MKKYFAVLYAVAVMVAGFGSASAQDTKNIVSPLSNAQFVKIINAVDKSEKVKFVHSDLATLLGVPTDKENSFKYFFFTTPDSVFHVFGRLNTNNDYLVVKRNANVLMFLHVDADLRLVAAATETIKAPNPFKVLPVPEAAKLLNDELTAWANYADTSLPKPPEQQ